MSARDNGGPAFPELYDPRPNPMVERGMTLRDYFAAKAMQGFCSNSHRSVVDRSFNFISEWAYEQADAMLAERTK